jgi:hypothetical protein
MAASTSGISLLFSILMLGALSGCSEDVIDQSATFDSATTTCQPGSAEILVGDGYLKSVCGCSGSPETVTPPASLTCSVPVNTTLFFLYAGTRLTHQIVPTVQDSLPASGVSSVKSLIHSHTVIFAAPGTYGFYDNFNSAMVGQIVVQ